MDISQDGKHIATGGFYKSAHIMDIDAINNTSLKCKFDLDGSRRDKVVGRTSHYETFTGPNYKEKKLPAPVQRK